MKRILPSQRHDCDDNNEDGRSSSSYGHQTRSDGHRRVRAFLFVVVVMLMGGLWIDAQEQVTMDRPLDGTTASREKKKQKNEQQQQQLPTTTTTTSGRMNITETLQSIMNSTTTPTSSDKLLDMLFQVLPDPYEQTTLEIYNMTTHRKLLESIGSSRRSSSSTNDNFTICVNGGSSSAGAGGVRLEDRYFTKYYQYLTTRSILVRSSSQVVDRSHGNRNSLHSAMFAENFLPKNVDLLLWEFAINDGEQQQQLQKQQEQQQQQSALLAWLQQVERMKPEPPKVILVYLWPAFRLDESKTIINPVFVAHEQIAREFDFVLGHVNLISYIHEMKFPSWEDTQILYSADWMHINELGHSIVAFLLLHLVHGKTNHEKNKEDTPTTTTTTHKSDFTWHCGSETKEKRLIQSRIIGGGGGKFRSPLVSWTLEVPQNSEKQQSASFHTSANGVLMSSPFDITYLGMQDPLRQDRQGSIPLPCCSTKKKDNNSVATTTIGIVTANTTSTTMDNVLLPPQPTGTAQAIFLGFGQIRPFDSIQIDILHQHSMAESPETNRIPAGTLVVVDNDNHWASCMWNFPAFYHSYWYVLESEIAPPSAIRLCVESQEQCSQGSNNSGMMLVSMAVF